MHIAPDKIGIHPRIEKRIHIENHRKILASHFVPALARPARCTGLLTILSGDASNRHAHFELGHGDLLNRAQANTDLSPKSN